MAGAKGCQDDCASTIIFILNSLLLILTILGLAGIIFVWITQSDLEVGGEQALSVSIPEFILVTAIVVTVCVMSIALLGIIATALRMKTNKAEADGKAKPAPVVKDKDGKIVKGKKPSCCHSWGLGIYVMLCIFAFFFLLAVAAVCGIYSDKMTDFNSLDTVRDKGDGWLDTFETQVSDKVKMLAKEYPKTWNSTQAAIGCCGWNIENGNITAFSNSKCCQETEVVNSVNVIGKIKLDYAGCKKDSDKKVYTCEGIVASFIQGNLVKTSISSVALAIVQLLLGVCGCMVRYPQCFVYCNVCCKKKGKNGDDAVHPNQNQDQDTPVQPIRKTESGGMI